MTRALRSVTSGTALLLALGAQAPYAQPGQDARIAIETVNGALRLRVFSCCRPFTVDPRALRFTVRAYDGFRLDPNAPVRPVEVRLGPMARQSDLGPQTQHAYVIPIVVVAPARPGMYELSVDAAPGFARAEDGAALPEHRFPVVGIGAIAAWWPDDRVDDAGLRDVRARFQNRVVHGYGGLALACPTWGTQVGPETGISVGSVNREVGSAAVLTTGATWSGDVAFHFLAFDPLALHLVNAIGSSPRLLPPCDLALRFADPWHVDTSLTTARPPRLARSNDFPVRVGMSRNEVVWRRGYPNAYGTVASFRAQDHWDYISPTPFSWSVTFAHDRVVEVHPPGRLP